MGSERKDSIRIGPWVMIHHFERADDLLRAFAIETGKEILKIGVLENNSHAVKLLHCHNFIQTTYSWRMIRGQKGDWTLSNNLYAICSAARG